MPIVSTQLVGWAGFLPTRLQPACVHPVCNKLHTLPARGTITPVGGHQSRF